MLADCQGILCSLSLLLLKNGSHRLALVFFGLNRREQRQRRSCRFYLCSLRLLSWHAEANGRRRLLNSPVLLGVAERTQLPWQPSARKPVRPRVGGAAVD